MAIPTITAEPIDFALTPLATPYAPFYAKILDNVFTPAECRSLLALVSASSSSGISSLPTGWHPAGLSSNAPTQTVHTDFRNSDRALVIDGPTADFIYARLHPHVPELHLISPGSKWATIMGRPGKKQGPTWALAGVNPRLSFLRYGPGHYFKPHCDGLNEVDGRKSFVTLHIYLNDAENTDKNSTPEVIPLSNSPLLPTAGNPITPPLPASNPQSNTPLGASDPLSISQTPLRGGATRFWTPDKKAFLDVFPKAGRVLIFQQRMLVHSGEPVITGVKYTVRSDFLFVDGPAEGEGAQA